MKFSEFCINRPVFTIVLSLILIVFGIVGYQRLPVRELPNINPPVVMISTNFPGASPQLIESQVTTPIEQHVSSMSGLKTIESRSHQGRSFVVMRIKLGMNINQIANDVRNKLAWITRSLPKGCKAPVVFKMDPNDTEAVILDVTDNVSTPAALTQYVKNYVVPQLERIPGVARVDWFGARNYAMRLWLNPWKMATHQITVPDIQQVIAAQIENVPGGQIKSADRYYSVLTDIIPKSANAFNNIVLRQDNSFLLRLKNIGHAKLGAEDTDDAMRADGKPALGLGLIAQTTANPINIVRQTRVAIKQIQKTLPNGMKIKLIYNNDRFVQAALTNVKHSILEAVVLVILVILLFLGSLRATFVPVVTIPICLVAVFGFIYLLGYSINIITLLALVLAIGLVVDDAIVMVENIYRHIENRVQPFKAAIIGSKEIGFAIIAMTITLTAVYAPIAFARGMTGVIFRQFAFTLAIIVLISGFVALTLSPMLCARFLQPRNRESWFTRAFQNGFHRLEKYYKCVLKIALRRWSVVVLILLLLAGGGYWLYKSLPSNLAPAEDTASFRVIISTPIGSSFNYTNQYAKQIEKLFTAIPQMQSYMMMVGFPSPDNAFAWVILKPWGERKQSQQQIMQALSKKTRQIPGARVFAVSPTTLGGHSKQGSGMSFVLMTTGSYHQLYHSVTELKAKLLKNPGFRGVRSNLQMNNEQYRVTIKRNLAATLGVSIADITKTLATMVGGSVLGTYASGDQSYDIIAQMKPKYTRDLSAIKQLYVRSKSGTMIPLSSLVKVRDDVGPVELPHYNRLRSAKIYAQLQPGYSFSKAIAYLQKTAKSILPENTQYQFSGSARRMLESRHVMGDTFLLALVFIYLVLAAQFESFIDPLIILLSVPLCIVSALFTLKMVGGSLNIYSNIGMVTLVGLIAKHGILITEFSNQLRAKGKQLEEALIEAASLRLRPILMTTGAMVLGALPLALAHGAGAESRQQIGWVIVGGMLFGTFFSLFVVPVAYSLLGRFRKPSTHAGGYATSQSSHNSFRG